MSLPSRPHERGPATRPRRRYKVEDVQQLEQLCLLAPIVPTNQFNASTIFPNQPNTQNIASIVINDAGSLATSAAAYTSVSQLTSSSAFGGDIVRIEAGPGGDFGKGVYAISRGAGDNAALGAVNRPGVIYRVDPATGKASVFFDLNTVAVLNGNAGNTLGADTGLVNWYDITFDPEGYFDGKTSMFVSSVDRTNPEKNVIFRIGPDGSFLGAYIKFTDGAGSGAFTRSPSAVLVTPPEQQAFLRGLVMGDGSTTGAGGLGTGFVGLFFDANEFRPGTDLNSQTLPPGVVETGLFFGRQVGLTSTSTNTRYQSPVYAAFTDFGTPPGPGDPGNPGLSGIQGTDGDLLIGNSLTGSSTLSFPVTTLNTTAAQYGTVTTVGGDVRGVDTVGAIGTPYRRLQDVAFDAYGYFSYGATVTTASGTIAVTDPVYAGSMFTTDLGTGLAVSVDFPDSTGVDGSIAIPVQGSGIGGLLPANQTVPGGSVIVGGITIGGVDFNILAPSGNLGGRIARIEPDGTMTTFAEGFNTSGDYLAGSFVGSSLSISFSADGTTLYAADDDGIWQFKSVLSLAGSTTGILTGLNDLRSLGVPYEGQDSAVAVIDTGVDADTPNFRGRVAIGKNVVRGGRGDDDPTSATTQPNGHGTLVAGVVAQFVPQATLQPVNVFTSNQSTATGVTSTTTQYVYNGMSYVNQNPFVKDPVRPNKVDRVVTSVFGFGTNSTFDTEGVAFRRYPQIVLSLKAQMTRMRRLGIAPVVAAGQLGAPPGDTPLANLGDDDGMSLPSILGEAISVTGTYPFPYIADAFTGPDDPDPGAAPRPTAPIILTGGGANASAAAGSQLITTGSNNGNTVILGDQILFKDKLLVAANRNATTDFAAPAIDVPTFRRTFNGDDNNWNVFRESGTSLSAGVAAGSFAVVTSALNYWITLAQTVDGATVDAYLTMPVGQRSLSFGTHGLLDLSLYANPDGVNSILQWTAVPAADAPNTLDTVNPPPLFGSESFRNYSRIDVGNAIAAIEGAVALDYLFAHDAFAVIDGNQDGLITAQEIQVFVDKSATIGLPEEGAMARFLGGTARIASVGTTLAGESPDNDDVLQRRFNFFDYAANGELKGVISIQQLRTLAHRLLPTPDTYTVNDRQRASNTGWLVDARPVRNWAQLQHILPTYAWVPRRLAAKFAKISPARWHVGRGQLPSSVDGSPAYTLFESARNNAAQARASENSGGNRSSNNSDDGTTRTASNSGGRTSNTGGTTSSSSTSSSSSTAGGTTTDHSQQIMQAIQNLANGTNPGPATPASSQTSTTSAATPISNSTTDGGSPAGTSEVGGEHRASRSVGRAPQAAPEKHESGWDWVKDKLFDPGEWF